MVEFKQRIDVMVSSTSSDLKAHRVKAREAILRVKWHPEMMEHDGAAPENALERSLRYVDEADIYILILGFRYGSIPQIATNPNRLSYTELEYRYACERQARGELTILTFLMSAPPEDHVEEDAESIIKLNAFRADVADASNKGVSAFFTNPDTLYAEVLDALHKLARLRNTPIQASPDDTLKREIALAFVHFREQFTYTQESEHLPELLTLYRKIIDLSQQSEVVLQDNLMEYRDVIWPALSELQIAIDRHEKNALAPEEKKQQWFDTIYGRRKLDLVHQVKAVVDRVQVRYGSEYSEAHQRADLRLLEKIWQTINTDSLELLLQCVIQGRITWDSYQRFVDYLIKREERPEYSLVHYDVEQALSEFDRNLGKLDAHIRNSHEQDNKEADVILRPKHKLRILSDKDRKFSEQERREALNTLELLMESLRKLVQIMKTHFPEFDFLGAISKDKED